MFNIGDRVIITYGSGEHKGTICDVSKLPNGTDWFLITLKTGHQIWETSPLIKRDLEIIRDEKICQILN
jgi:hypothetical protein